MEIKFIGNKPEKTIYAYAVKENNDTNKIEFLLDKVQEGGNLDLANYIAFAKIRGANFVDKVPLIVEIVEEKIKLSLTLQRKHTSSRGLDIQLQFEYFTTNENVLVWQTEIFTMVLSDTIPADEEIANKYPAILQDHEKRIFEEEEKSVVFADQIQNHEARMANVETHNEVQDAEITALDEKISRALAGVFHYKGSVETFENLPSLEQEVGDTYNVLDTGDNYTWSGSAWDKLSGIVDLSNYYTSEETDTLLDEKADKDDLTNYYTKNEVDASMGEKANSDEVVDLASNQTITGKKTVDDVSLDFKNTKTSLYNAQTFSVKIDPYNNLTISLNNALRYLFGNEQFSGAPNGTRDLGSNQYKWKDFYLAGKLKDGTNEIAISEIAKKTILIKLDSGTYTSGSTMSDNDYNQLLPLLDLSYLELIELGLKFAKVDNSRNEVQMTTNYQIRKGGTSYSGDWYDIKINFGDFGTIIIMPTKIRNKIW